MNNFSGYFLDSGNLDQVNKWNFLIGGVTTNQIILFSKDHVVNIPQRIKAIINLIGPHKPLSVELPDSHWSEKKLIELGQKYHSLGPENVVIKVPIITTSQKGLRLIHSFSRMGIRTNATVGMNFGQLSQAAEAGRPYSGKTPNYISLFWARTIESYQRDQETTLPDRLLASMKNYIHEHGLSTQIIVGSIRSPQQVMEAFFAGADVVTVTPELMGQLLVNQRAEETIAEFDQAFHQVERSVRLI